MSGGGSSNAVAGLLLTGGASRRMGRDKALLEVGGRRLVDRAASVLAAVADPVLEVGPGWSELAS
ncbi:MAG TPA: NTP transferase domain-containing protein, partial [Acidimicrobiia bacterium]|nr:NTP transferase domain-containing protein [Acidimicrobiia bacterium]